MPVWIAIGGLRGALAASVAVVLTVLTLTTYDRLIDDPAVASAAATAAKKDLVAKAELDAANAKNAQLSKQLAAGRKAAEGFAELLTEAQAKAEADAAADVKKDADYVAKLAAQGRSCRITQSDRDFVRQP